MSASQILRSRRWSRRSASAVLGLAAVATVVTASVAEGSVLRPDSAAPVSSAVARQASAGATGATTVRQVRSAGASRLRQVKHVWNIVLENEDYANTFGSTAGPYLSRTLRHRGALLTNYYGTGHASNDNYISLISGQAANVDNQSDCLSFSNFPAVDRGRLTPGEPGQQLGYGCVYPKTISEIGSQLTAKHLSWKAYMEDMGNLPAREAASCGRPAVGSKDGTQQATKGDGYAARHDPFVYFHKVIDSASYCKAHVVAQGTTTGTLPKHHAKGETGLAHDLRHLSTTPAYSFITPNLCDDGHDFPCKTGQKSLGTAQADIDRWLEAWVPKIMHSAAYKKNGLIEITFDESDGAQSDSHRCCSELIDPNATGGLAGETGPGGGRIGALLISPYVTAGGTVRTAYNHYSTLATDETIFGLSRLGYASTASTFPPSLFHRKTVR